MAGPLARINRLGLRGHEQDAWTRHVCILGDSFTFGSGVGDDETFAARLDHWLGGTVSVINGSQPGYGHRSARQLHEPRRGLYYNFVNWTPKGQDCCGPAQTSYPSISQLRGKWWRFEYAMINRNGPGHNSLLYVKSATDNSAEQLIYDFSQLNFWSPQFTPPSPVRVLRASQYAQGRCAGFAAVSHFMVSGWDIDVGQRIGPAYEIEGRRSR